MSELNRHLTTALQAMEQGINRQLDRQAQDISNLQQTVNQIQARQQRFEQELLSLSNVSATLQSLLTRLNSLFADK